MHKKGKVYLAGPISGCNDAQRKGWREDIRKSYGERFEFLDPTEAIVDRQDVASQFKIALRDADAITQADAMIANMWKESIGTAIGVVLARCTGKIVVVVDRNHIENAFLMFYADAVVHSEAAGIEHIGVLLDAQHWLVEKRDGELQKFERSKLNSSLRRACEAAGQNDIVMTAELLPEVLKRLAGSVEHSRKQVSAEDIVRTVFDSLRALGEERPARAAAFMAVSVAWSDFRAQVGNEQRLEEDKLRMEREIREYVQEFGSLEENYRVLKEEQRKLDCKRRALDEKWRQLNAVAKDMRLGRAQASLVSSQEVSDSGDRRSSELRVAAVLDAFSATTSTALKYHHDLIERDLGELWVSDVATADQILGQIRTFARRSPEENRRCGETFHSAPRVAHTKCGCVRWFFDFDGTGSLRLLGVLSESAYHKNVEGVAKRMNQRGRDS